MLTDKHTCPPAGWLHLESFNIHSESHSSRHSIKADSLQKQSPTNRCTNGKGIQRKEKRNQVREKKEQSRSREKSEARRHRRERNTSTATLISHTIIMHIYTYTSFFRVFGHVRCGSINNVNYVLQLVIKMRKQSL